jgi:hypothetical protein
MVYALLEGFEMVLEIVRGDVLSTECKHIIFAVNIEGLNDAGFAGRITSDFWPEIRYEMRSPLGTVFEKKLPDGRTLHAIACHSLCVGGWNKTADVLEECFRTKFAAIPDDEVIASVQIGGGPVGEVMGADVVAIRGVMERSPKNFLLYIR